MLKHSYYLFFIRLLLIFLVLQACNTDSNKLPSHSKPEVIKGQNTEIEPHDIDQTYRFKSFKIDSSNFEIRASKTSWLIAMEPDESFNSQMDKLISTMKGIAEVYDIEQLKSVSIQPINKELLLDIALVPSIQSELQAKKNTGIVNSMGVVSPEAHKSPQLNQLTNLFLKHKLKVSQYYIDKCTGISKPSDSLQLTMFCAGINFKLFKQSTSTTSN